MSSASQLRGIPTLTRTPSEMKPRVLLLDDDSGLTAALEKTLQPSTLEIASATTLDEAIRILTETRWDVVVSDLYLCPGTGLDLMARMRAANIDAGVVLMTGRPHLEDLARALRLGACDFVIKPISAQLLRQSVQHAFHKVRAMRAEAEQMREDSLALQAASERLHVLESTLINLEDAVLESLMSALAVRERDALPHSLRIREYAMHLAEVCGYPPSLRKHLAHAALLHDIGKVGLSDTLLFGTGPFTASEVQGMRPHAVIGEQILRRIEFLRPASLIVRHHHERFDGTGYPDRLAGEAIPLGARLFTIADALDALTNDRVYRLAGTFEEAQAEIIRWSGRQFDPALIELFRRVPAGTWRQLRQRVDERVQKQREPLRLLRSNAEPAGCEFASFTVV